jgi:predicted nucleic acid-binding protein
MIAIDATIAAKWCLNEAGSRQALALIVGSRDPLVAPDLIQLEVAGAITRRHRMGGLNRAEAEMLISDWKRDLDLGRVTLESWQELLEDAADLALSTAHGLVDCLYLACAMRLGVPLLTSDEKLLRRGSIAYGAIKLL